MNNNSKFLVVLLNKVSQHQWFFLVWALIALFFVKLIMNYHKSTNQRNFKGEDGNSTTKGKSLTIVSTNEGLQKQKDEKP